MSNPYAYQSTIPSQPQFQGSRGDEAHRQLMTPAIVLLAFSAISMIVCLPLAIMIPIVIVGQELPPDAPTEPGPERTGYMIGFYGTQIAMAVVPWISIPANGFTIWGCVCMIRRKNWNVARFGALASVVPCVSACCVVGIPFGAWCLVLLNDPDLKASFDQPDRPAGPAPGYGGPVAYGQPGFGTGQYDPNPKRF